MNKYLTASGTAPNPNATTLQKTTQATESQVTKKHNFLTSGNVIGAPPA